MPPINNVVLEDEEEEGGSSSTTPPPPRSRPRGKNMDPLLVVCRCFSVITSLTAILCIAVNILSAVRSFKYLTDIFDVVFRCYAVVIALFVVAAETEWPFIFKFWRILEYWAGRGMLQIFVAVMTRAFSDVNEERKDILLLQEIACYLLLACGVMYVISGVLCIGFLKRARQKETTRSQVAKDLEELERRREELEALLNAERA